LQPQQLARLGVNHAQMLDPPLAQRLAEAAADPGFQAQTLRLAGVGVIRIPPRADAATVASAFTSNPCGVAETTSAAAGVARSAASKAAAYFMGHSRIGKQGV
jgi:hypothetical protein